MSISSAIEPNTLIGSTVVGTDGVELGEVDGVYLDSDTSEPEWVTVKSGKSGNRVSLVPLAHADYDGTELSVPYGNDQLDAAPRHDADEDLTHAEEAELFEHYGVANGGQRTATDAQTAAPGAQGSDTSGPSTDEAMTRSEEQLHVGVEKTETGKARLRKYVVTEEESRTVPVGHEEVRVTREPITDANRDQALSGADITEAEHEITLHAERPVVGKETVPVERVRLGTETVTEEQTVDEQVRKEQIDEPHHHQEVANHPGTGRPRSGRPVPGTSRPRRHRRTTRASPTRRATSERTAMTAALDPHTPAGTTVVGVHGDTIGTLTRIYLDDHTQPRWAAVRIGTHTYLMPATGARAEHDTVVVDYTVTQLSTAPHRDPSAEPTAQVEHDLCRHYGIADATPSGAAAPAPAAKRRRRCAGGDDDPLRGAAARRHRAGPDRDRAAGQIHRHRVRHADRAGHPRRGPGRVRTGPRHRPGLAR